MAIHSADSSLHKIAENQLKIVFFVSIVAKRCRNVFAVAVDCPKTKAAIAGQYSMVGAVESDFLQNELQVAPAEGHQGHDQGAVQEAASGPVAAPVACLSVAFPGITAAILIPTDRATEGDASKGYGTESDATEGDVS